MWNFQQLMKTLKYSVIFFAIFSFGYVWERLSITSSILHYQKSIQDPPPMRSYNRTLTNGSSTKVGTTLVGHQGDRQGKPTVMTDQSAVQVTNISGNALPQRTTTAKGNHGTTKGTDTTLRVRSVSTKLTTSTTVLGNHGTTNWTDTTLGVRAVSTKRGTTVLGNNYSSTKGTDSLSGVRSVAQVTPSESGRPNVTPEAATTLTRESTPCSSANCSGNSESYPTFITGTPIGGLGNQLFVYASIVGLAAHYNATPFINRDHGIVKVFKIPQVSNITVINARKIHTGCCKYVKPPVAEGRHNWTIFGYAQSWKYFANVSKTLRRSLQFRTHVLRDARNFLTNWTKNGSTLVGIHVRRGDFLHVIGYQEGRTVASAGYIKRAQDFFRSKSSNVQFVVVSKDHAWCQANITGSDVVHSSFTDAGTDLALLALCDHVIMTVGTFGWWGAWLADGITVYYKDYPRPGSVLFNGTAKEDLFMPNWIAMS